MNPARPVSALGFWLATVLPLAYVPLLLVGVEDPEQLALVVGLLALNVAAFVVGRNYRAGGS